MISFSCFIYISRWVISMRYAKYFLLYDIDMPPSLGIWKKSLGYQSADQRDLSLSEPSTIPFVLIWAVWPFFNLLQLVKYAFQTNRSQQTFFKRWRSYDSPPTLHSSVKNRANFIIYASSSACLLEEKQKSNAKFDIRQTEKQKNKRGWMRNSVQHMAADGLTEINRTYT